VDYPLRFSGPRTALTARRVQHGRRTRPHLPALTLHVQITKLFLTINSSHQQPWHPSSWLMQPLRLVFSFDHLTSALFGPSTSLNAPSLADPRCRRFSAPDHTQTLLSFPLLPSQNPSALLPLLPFQNPPGLLRARNLLDLRARTGSSRPG
jgi:hypothetical protein